MELEIRTAAELIDPELEARWTARRAGRETALLQHILRAFVERGGPVEVAHIVAAFADGPPERVRADLARLDTDDLIQLGDGRVDIAYPFSAVPTPFLVQLADGPPRYACCAIDALGIAPMLGQSVRIRSRCHHCGESLELSVDQAGHGLEAQEVMVWVGKQGAGERRASTSL
ncbi:MAG TPA: organomercurial lyase [Methylomirabilota bacterium]|nr:organomercurial lyase [Methylomirabilota bacterium]